MKKHLLISTILFLTLRVGHAQTNVSGGIYSNTTWTLANSPYIVVDTVVVFPGVTLTIKPGVVVKFSDNKRLEIRQAKLIALGTITDSITFTSNSSSPAPGIWSAIFLNKVESTDTLKFNYCNFKYASVALDGSNSGYSIIIKNSVFSYNKIALTSAGCNYALVDTCNFRNNVNYGIAGLVNAKLNGCEFSYNGIGMSQISYGAYNVIDNCSFYYNQYGITDLGVSTIQYSTFKHNQGGIIVGGGYAGSYATVKNCVIDSNNVVGISINDGDTIINNQITHNPTGLNDAMVFHYYDNVITKNTIENNGIGIKLFYSQNQLYCNKICNNTSYDLYYDVAFGSNLNASNNYWCTSDSTSTTAVIYDGYDNINLGLVNFMPLDTEQCYLATGIPMNTVQHFSFNIFPNPFSTQTTLQTDIPLHNATLMVDNCFGQTITQIRNINGQTIVFNRDNLPSGLYFVRLMQDSKIIAAKKLIITD
ncbi:MAG TPA: right-handed parallel beta-helix repeat-containing protein [Chitinophagales bacterium]|nr:right-handed parallel beta-helix repeat-containing protein [Chitinophagales bacterium]